MKELSSRQRAIRFVGATTVFLAEACGFGSPAEQITQDFVGALSSGDTDRALSLVAPDVRRDQAAKQQLSAMAQLINGCKISDVVVRSSSIGALIRASEEATVTFKEPCGDGGQLFNRGTKFSGISVGLDKVREGNNDRYFVNPFVVMPLPIISNSSFASTPAPVLAPAVSTPEPKFVPKIVKPEVKVLAKPTLTPEPSPTPQPTWKISPLEVKTSDKDPYGVSTGEGWQWLQVRVLVENTTKNQKKNFWINDSGALLITKEGYTYNHHGAHANCDMSLEIPPGFRLLGEALPKFVQGKLTYDWYPQYFQYCFKVAQETSGHVLQVNDGGRIELGKNNGVDINKLHFPTDRPETDFKEFGSTFEVMQGNLTFVDFVKDENLTQRVHGNSIIYRLQLKFANQNKGMNARFRLVLSDIFGNDGFKYGVVTESGPTTPGKTDLGREILGEVGPGITREFAMYIRLPADLSGGKLVVGYDNRSEVNAIFNLRLH